MPLEPGGKPRVELYDPGGFKNVQLRIDGEVVHTFADHAELQAGWKEDLSDDRRLEVALRQRYGSFLPRIDVRVNGRALPGSSWDPAHMVKGASNALLALAAWPLLDIVTAGAQNMPLLIVQAVLFAGLGGLARTGRRAIVATALVLATLLLALRMVLVFYSPVAWYWKALSVLIVLWMIRDVRAAFDLAPRATSAATRA